MEKVSTTSSLGMPRFTLTIALILKSFKEMSMRDALAWDYSARKPLYIKVSVAGVVGTVSSKLARRISSSEAITDKRTAREI